MSVDERAMVPPSGFARASDPADTREPPPVLDLHGATREGHSVLVHVHGFLPYFYALAPPPHPELLKCCRQALDGLRNGSPVVVDMEELERMPLMGYQDMSQRFLRIVMKSQKVTGMCKSAIERGLRLRTGAVWKSPIYEANVAFGLRFLVDAGLCGGGWVDIAAGRFKEREPRQRTSTAQIEVDVHWQSVKGHRAEGEWLGLAPLRMMALSLRTVGTNGAIASAAAVLQVQGEATPRHQAVWVVNSSDPRRESRGVPDTDMFTFDSETALLRHLRDFIVEVDADVLVGYDLLNKHLSVLIARAEANAKGQSGIGAFCLGRILHVTSKARSTTFQTNQLGKHETKDINIEGRILFDVLTVIEREQKLVSYSLSALSQHFLKEARIEIRSSTAEKLSREAPERLAELALQDACLSLRLLDQQKLVFRYVEMARVTGVPLEYLLTRGQSVKVFSMLLRKARANGYVLPPPSRINAGEDSYEGGAVLEPQTGFYDEPIVTLDFASLYPSIMRKHNLCYSTLIQPGSPMPPDRDAIEVVPTLGHKFVTSKLRRGLVPMVLEELLTARALAKKEMKATKDAQMRAVLDGRQLALKISANSVYGFTGMAVGTLPCQAIAASVTAYGREMIEHTRRVVEEKYQHEKGSPFNARVIYGDTDSVMISLGAGCPLERAFVFGKEAAEVVSKEFGDPVKMEFEKVFHPFLLMAKKRYAGLAWERPEGPGQLSCKGIETVRRDWCELVRHVVESSLDLLLKERSPERAMAYVQESISALRQGKIDLRLLVISKTLVRDGAEQYSAKQAHVELAEKLRQRNPELAPQTGERVPYVFTVAASKAPAYDRAEDPLYAIEHDLPIDADYYIEHQLKSPLMRIFGPVLGASVESKLFAGDHTRRIVVGSGGSSSGASGSGGLGRGGLAAFARPRARCLGCRTLLPGADGALCNECSEPDRAGAVVLAQLAIARPLEVEVASLFSQCVRCVRTSCGSLHTECANVDCPIFFRRIRAARDLENVQESLRKLQLDW